MKLISFAASGRSSYGAVVGDGVVDFGRRLGDRYPGLTAARFWELPSAWMGHEKKLMTGCAAKAHTGA